ncbi:hypothetical protein HK100_009264 [Physocladia obscura]|uniref:Uncharacterized protein n=1 Tax=Physocladia obscura TaxID=109957 RepID=A0AAD5T564_9FUNG|nr:hypothetical protein HK100_009264 [Physocladia obscura]
MTEKEKLRKIVQDAAELLDRIQQDHYNERANEYREILQQSEDQLTQSLQQSVTNPLATAIFAPSPISNPIDLLQAARGIRADHLFLVKDTLDRVVEAVEEGLKIVEGIVDGPETVVETM